VTECCESGVWSVTLHIMTQQPHIRIVIVVAVVVEGQGGILP